MAVEAAKGTPETAEGGANRLAAVPCIMGTLESKGPHHRHVKHVSSGLHMLMTLNASGVLRAAHANDAKC